MYRHHRISGKRPTRSWTPICLWLWSIQWCTFITYRFFSGKLKQMGISWSECNRTVEYKTCDYAVLMRLSAEYSFNCRGLIAVWFFPHPFLFMSYSFELCFVLSVSVSVSASVSPPLRGECSMRKEELWIYSFCCGLAALSFADQITPTYFVIPPSVSLGPHALFTV